MFTKTMLPLAAAVLISAVSASPAGAVPIEFDITGAAFTPGSGYGIDATEASGSATLLDVRFSTAAFVTQAFNLNFVGDFATFQFGTVNLAEPNGSGANGIAPAETDFLGVTARFTFVNPLGSLQDVLAVGTATVGAIDDAATDYNLVFTPQLVNFGTTGVFRINLESLSFTGNGTQNLNATITLVADDVTQPTRVPEPASFALIGTGLLGYGFVRRRRAKTRT